MTRSSSDILADFLYWFEGRFVAGCLRNGDFVRWSYFVVGGSGGGDDWSGDDIERFGVGGRRKLAC